jgi:hypothetical protein
MGKPVFIVDKVTESGGVDDIESQSDAILLNVGRDGADVDGLGDFDRRWAHAVPGGVQAGIEERVDQRRLAEPRFTCKQRQTRLKIRFEQIPPKSGNLGGREVRTDDHDIKVESLADRLAVPLVGQIGESNIAGQLPPHDIPR